MENKLQLFESEEFGKFGVLLIEDKPYFPATECAKVLGYKDTTNAIKQHCKGVVKHHLLTKGGTQAVNLITEGDLYRLIIRSKLPNAEKFEQFVFDEVLPSIRKHGAYLTNDTLDKMLNNPEGMFQLLQTIHAEREKISDLKVNIDLLAPKARYYDIILQSRDAFAVSLIAKDYGMSANFFNTMLHGFKIQYKQCGTWLPYQPYANDGYTTTKTYLVNNTTPKMYTCWTQKGRFFLYEFLKAHNILPVIERNETSPFFDSEYAK